MSDMSNETTISVKHNGNSIILFNQKNATQQKNIFRYQFPSGSVNFKGRQLAISSLIIPYSWYNVSTGYLNNSLSIIFPVTDGTATQTLAITIPDGFYTLQQMNQYLQYQMIDADLYAIESGGTTNVYFVDIVPSPTLNGAQINCYIVPNDGSDYDGTSPYPWPSTGTRVPQVVINNQAFGSLIGFTAGSYPASTTQTSTYSITSNIMAQISPVSSVIVGCNLINNLLSSPNSIIACIPITSTFGAQITYVPNELLWVNVLDGTFPYFDMVFYDQEGNQLPINDTNIIATLVIK